MKKDYRIIEKYLKKFNCPRYRVQKRFLGIWITIFQDAGVYDCKEYIDKHRNAKIPGKIIEY